jgi:hypothetical protein
MPTPYLTKLAEKHHRSIDYVEKLWDKAKDVAETNGHKDDWAYTVGVLKKMMGEKASFDPIVDTVTMDVPLLTRILELSREEVKSDADLHFVLERIIAASKTTQVLTMRDYATIAGKQPEAKPEAVAQINRVLSRLRLQS